MKVAILNYGPFCHGALKYDISTLFTTFFVWTSLQFILSFTTLLSVPCGGLKNRPVLAFLCCHISPVQISDVVFTVDIIAYGPFCHGAL